MKLYLISGLGADGRLFAPLLPHLPAMVRPQVLEWLPPAAPNEPLAAYAVRLATPIPLDETCWVAGVSFGGIVALEIGRLRPQACIIQISSLSAAELLPLQLRLLRRLRLVSLASPQLLRWFPGIGNWFFGIREPEMAKLLRSFMQQLDAHYLRWSLQTLLHWDSAGVGSAITLHGTRDRVFPLSRRQVDYQIFGGPHFMVHTHAREVGAALTQILTAVHAS